MSSSQAASVLRDVFGFDGFRPLQAQAIEAIESGRDVQLVLPTGGGKSLCYQVPAIGAARAGAGPTVVVSPLIALMEDQVSALNARGVRAVALHSGIPWPEQREALDQLEGTALVYASPERLANKRFRARLARARPAFIAVDEAHCISEWGHDFRPEYRKLGVLKKELCVPIVAVTATATRAVLDDVGASLGQVDPVQVLGGFERENLSLQVHHIRGDNARLEWAARRLVADGFATKGKAPGRALVYAVTRKRVQAAHKLLRKAGIKAAYYHGGRSDSARTNAQRGFESGKYPVLVATSAFGMGVDMPDVRVVVHVQAPGTLEGYYQQAGRAGRDGLDSDCVLLYGPSDALTHKRLRGAAPRPGAVEGWRALTDYAFGTRCRQQTIVQHFAGGPAAPCMRCDACVGQDQVQARVDTARAELAERASKRAHKKAADDAAACTPDQHDLIRAFVEGLKKPLGKRLIAQGLRGSKAKPVKRKGLQRNPQYGALNGVPEVAIVRAISEMLDDGRLVPKGKKYPTVWLPDKRVRPKVTAAERAARPPRKRGLREDLRDLRKRLARTGRLKAYQVFPNKTLALIVAARPCSHTALEEIWGMGPRRAKKYGADILAVVAEWSV